MRKTGSSRWTFPIVFGLLLASSLTIAHAQWTLGGGDIRNTRSANNENKINTKNVKDLKVKWSLTTAGDVSATPTVEKSKGVTSVYAVDWGGYLYSINGENGNVNWSHTLS